MRELYQVPGIAATVKPRYYVIGYWSVKKVNPSGIIPKGAPAPYLEQSPAERRMQ
jgi:putative glutathione S-transferase